MCRFIAHFHKMCNKLVTQHQAENSRMLIEYSVHKHVHTVHPETARWLFPWRLAVMCFVHPAFTSAQLSTSWTHKKLRPEGLLRPDCVSHTIICCRKQCFTFDVELEQRGNTQSTTTKRQHEDKLKDRKKMTHTSLNSSKLVAGVKTSKRPIT